VTPMRPPFTACSAILLGGLLCLGAAAAAISGAAIASGATASRATIPSPTKLLLTVQDMPSGFRVTKPARKVSVATEAEDFGVELSLFGLRSAASVAFERKASKLDSAVDGVTIDVMKFLSPDAAHDGYVAILNHVTGRSFNVGHIGDESTGRKISVIVTLRDVIWRYQNIIVDLKGTYLTERAALPPLLALARTQQKKLAKSLL
jgi:hypothetical protein